MNGRHALVTGGSRGIGAAIAAALLAEGCRVTIAARDAKTLAATAERLGGDCAWVTMDVSDATSVAAGLAKASERFGPPAILVNNAGEAAAAPFARSDAALFERMLAVNLMSVVECSRAALPAMQAAGWGRIVNVASVAGLTGYAYVTAYCAAKHAVVGFTRALAEELARSGITVNAVCPGYTDTDIVREAVANIVAKTGRSEAEARAELVKRNPQGRLVQPEEVADAVRWLCGDGATAITGQAIPVAGGEKF